MFVDDFGTTQIRKHSLAIPGSISTLRRRSSDSSRKKSTTSVDVPVEVLDDIMFNKQEGASQDGLKPVNPDQPVKSAWTSQQKENSLYHYLTPSWWNPAGNSDAGVSAVVIWSGFKEQTTAHGIPRLAMAKGPMKTAFWGISLGICVILLLYNFASITIAFFSYNTNVMLRLENQNQLEFPVVTICNMNPLRKSALEGSGLIGKKRKKRSVSPEPRIKRGAAACARNGTPPIAPTTTPIPPTTTTLVPPTVAGSQFPERIPVREAFQQEEKLTEAVAQINEEAKTQLGYQSTDMILDCQYSGADCNISTAFDNFYNPTHGNCFMFNSGWTDNAPLKKASKTGRRYGLHLIININQAEYTTQTGDTAGIRMLIHPRNRMPFPEDEGVTVSPGHATSIGIRQVVMTREGEPYGSCLDPKQNHSDINAYEELYPVKYSTSACQRTCYQKNVVKECGCGDPYFPLSGSAISPTPVKPCNSSNIVEDDCKYSVSRRFNNNTLKCPCLDSCRDVSYSNEVSLGQWPADTQKNALLQKYKDKIGSSFDIYDADAYKQNLIKLEVYYEEFNFETINEVPAYKSGRYISDIGGVLGLWVGFSILTIAEFIEVGMDLLVYCVGWIHRRKKDPQNSQDKVSGISPRPMGSARWYHVPTPPPGDNKPA